MIPKEYTYSHPVLGLRPINARMRNLPVLEENGRRYRIYTDPNGQQIRLDVTPQVRGENELPMATSEQMHDMYKAQVEAQRAALLQQIRTGQGTEFSAAFLKIIEDATKEGE